MSKYLTKFEGFTIWSGDYKNLASWYQETFELKKIEELSIPGDYAIAFEIEEGNPMLLWVGQHSEVEGKSKDPFRQMISFYTDDVEITAKDMKSKGVTILAGPGKSPDGSMQFLTLQDPELNLIQVFEI